MNKKKISLIMVSSIALLQVISAHSAEAATQNVSQANVVSKQLTSTSQSELTTSASNQVSSSDQSSALTQSDTQSNTQAASSSSAQSVQETLKGETKAAQVSGLTQITNIQGKIRVKNKQGTTLMDEKTGARTRVLGFKSAWLISKKAIDKSGQVWYKVSGTEYILAKDVFLYGTNMMVSTSNIKGIVKVKAAQGTAMVSNSGEMFRYLGMNSRWQTFRKGTDVFGDVWYMVSTNAYIRASDCYLEGQSVFHNPQKIGTVTLSITNGAGGNLMTNNGQITRKLPYKSNWLASSTVQAADGTVYYKVSGEEYLSSKDVRVLDGTEEHINNIQDRKGIVTVLNNKGTDTRNSVGKVNGHLKYQTRWQVSGIGTDGYGTKWYKVSSDQFVNANEVTNQQESMFQRFEGYSGVLVVSNYNGAVTRDSLNNKVKNLPVYSSWVITQKAIDKTGAIWYRVGTNQYVSATDMHAKTITVNKDMISGLPNNTSSNEFIVAHESGTPAEASNPNALENEVAYMKDHWTSAYVTHWVGHGGRIIQTAPVGRMSWGCGPTGNGKAFAQVELARTNDQATFAKDYQAYVRLLRFLADQAGISYKLDQDGKGIKTHLWISNAYHEVDHVDPYGYLQSMGVSKAKFARDLANGI